MKIMYYKIKPLNEIIFHGNKREVWIVKAKCKNYQSLLEFCIVSSNGTFSYTPCDENGNTIITNQFVPEEISTARVEE